MNHSNIETSNYRAEKLVRDHLDQAICFGDEKKTENQKDKLIFPNFHAGNKTRFRNQRIGLQFPEPVPLPSCQALVPPSADQLRLGKGELKTKKFSKWASQ